MVSQEDFDALKKRVSDLEETIAEEIKIFHNLSGALEAQSGLVDKVPALIEQVSALASIVENSKPKAG
jgi:hypothetical protein